MTTMPRSIENDELVVSTARTPDGLMRIRREVEGRDWAAAHGIPTAETLAADLDDGWLVSRRVVEEPGESPEYVVAALEMSRRIEALPHPLFASAGATWRAPRRTLPVRVARMTRAGLDLATFAAARRAFEVLPKVVTVHNDYHRQNVLNTVSLGHVTVIDWEFTAVGPRHQDMVRLIVDIHDPATAYFAWRLLVDSVPRADHPALAAQLRWLTLRTYGTEVTVDPKVFDPAKSERRRQRWLEAQQWADDVAPDHAVVPRPREEVGGWG